MGINAFQGSQLVGKITLTNGAPSGSIPIFTSRKTTITDGSPTPTVLFTSYVSGQAPTALTVPPGCLYGFAGTDLVATAGAVTAGKFVTVNLQGLVVHR